MRERDNKEFKAEVLQALLALTYGGNPSKTRFDLGNCSIRIITEEEADAEAPPRKTTNPSLSPSAGFLVFRGS